MEYFTISQQCRLEIHRKLYWKIRKLQNLNRVSKSTIRGTFADVESIHILSKKNVTHIASLHFFQTDS